jgi:ribonucleoside-triphosphate reductase (thioredoxin)
MISTENLFPTSYRLVGVTSVEEFEAQDTYDIEVSEVHAFNARNEKSGATSVSHNSAMISLFDLTDEAMLTCKFGNWWETNAQRGRSNNSAVILRHKVEKEDFLILWKKIEMSNSGEPGFFFSNDMEWGANPCCEISLRPFQFCNLCEINASDIVSQEDYNARVKAAAFIGTLQASYTNFHYLRDIWKRTTEREALIGVGMTGIASTAVLNLDMEEAANVVLMENERVANLLGINPAARTTTVKPSGTTSLVLGTSSGIHAWHDDYYVRRIRVGKNEGIYAYLAENHPEIVEDEFFKPTQQAVISIPQRAPDGAITRKESALELLDRVSEVWTKWVKTGHRKGANINNVSTTVTIKPHEWEEVGEWMWDNRDNFTALSVLPEDLGSYIQTPYETIDKEEYEDLVSHLHKIDLTQVIEAVDNTSLQSEAACGASGCEVT